jgi:ATP-dependent Clp protease ATP-binding subunit ClpA
LEQEAAHPFQINRFGRCARLAWDHAVEAFGEAASAGRPRPALMTAHLLLGVLQEPDCAGGLVLRKMGLDLALAQATNRFVLFYGRQPEEGTITAGDVEGTPITREARTALEYAWDEAEFYSATYPIGTEHLVLGILRVPQSAGARMLNHFGINVHHARATRDGLWSLLRLTE